MHYGIAPGSETVPLRFRQALYRRGMSDVEVIAMRPGACLTWDVQGATFR
jgi:hypothetical protein